MAAPRHLLLLVHGPASRTREILLDLVQQTGDRVPAGRGRKDALAGGHRVAGILPLVAEERVIPARAGGDLATMVMALAATALAQPLPSVGRFRGWEAFIGPESGPEFGMGEEDLDGYLDALVPGPGRVYGRGPGQVSFSKRATFHGPRFTLVEIVVGRLRLFSSGSWLLTFRRRHLFAFHVLDLGLVNHRRAVRVATYPSIRITPVPRRPSSSDVHFEGRFFEMEIIIIIIDVSRTNRGSPRAKQFIYAIIPTFLQGGVFESRCSLDYEQELSPRYFLSNYSHVANISFSKMDCTKVSSTIRIFCREQLEKDNLSNCTHVERLYFVERKSIR